MFEIIDKIPFSGPGNTLFVRIDGKVIELRITVFQHENYAKYVEAQAKKEPAKKEEGEGIEPVIVHVNILRQLAVNAYDLAEIALNPIRGKIDFTRQQIEETFDVDQIKFLTQEWIQRKIINPRLERESDPLRPLGNMPTQVNPNDFSK